MSGFFMMNMQGSGQGLSYTRLKWLEADGDEYVKLGLYPMTTYHVYCDFMLTGAVEAQAIYGGLTNDSGIFFGTGSSSGQVWCNNAGNGSIDYTLTANTRYSIHQYNGGVVINGTTFSTVNIVEQSQYQIYAFARNRASRTDRMSKCYMYSFKITNGDTVICDLIPVRWHAYCPYKTIDGGTVTPTEDVLGMYDKVRDVLLTNSRGTGSDFIAGDVA